MPASCRCRVLAGVVLLTGMAVAGCALQEEPPFRCSVPTAKNVGEAFAHTRRDLSHPECQFQFDAYVDTLLQTAAEDPGEQNKRRFSELFAFAREQGILSARQAERRYRRYFTTNFVSLDERYNNCSTTCRDPGAVRRALREELTDKDRGLLRAAGDRQRYEQADREYNQLLTLIEATCRACGRQ